MAHILFYEKPGCANNARQKLWLQAAGHQLEVRNLLTEPWTRSRLLGYFGERPVAEWFNRAAPRVKSGEIVPESLDAFAALDLMLGDPLLIRRPLIEAEGRCEAGFDVERIDAWLGLQPATRERLTGENPEACQHPHAADEGATCPPPASGNS